MQHCLVMGSCITDTLQEDGSNLGGGLFQHYSVMQQLQLKELTHYSGIVFTPFIPLPTKPWFLRVCNSSLLKTLGKGEIARNKQISAFSTVFSTRLENFLPFPSSLKLLSANTLSLEEFKICRLTKGSPFSIRLYVQSICRLQIKY